MSMTKQFWFAIVSCTVIVLTGSLLISLLNARSYLSEQLTLKNIDNANSLALTLSNEESDEISARLAVAAVFDGGQYESIRITDPAGKIIVEQHAAPVNADIPPWFVSLLPIEPDAGNAKITRGWKQFGTVLVKSESRFAYHSLWQVATQMTIAVVVICMIAGFLSSLILRRLVVPLREVVNQARGIADRRFAVIPLPRVPELAQLAAAMNLTVTRLQSMFESDAKRLEAVRREANFDGLTELCNRNSFLTQFSAALHASANGGMLVLIRIAGLAGINHRIGRAATDELIKAVANRMSDSISGMSSGILGRLNGADFALYIPDPDGDDFLHELLASVMSEAPRFGLDAAAFVFIGAVDLAPAAHHSLALAQADAALASAENSQHSGVIHMKLTESEHQPKSASEWNEVLHKALRQKQVWLERFPVVDMNQTLIAHERPLRLRCNEGEAWQPAARFVPIAERLRITADIDMTTLDLGITALADTAAVGDVILNLSPQSIAELSFRRYLLSRLLDNRNIADRLWLEFAESGALLHLDALAALCRDLAPLGCRVGIEHFGHQFSAIGRIYQIGLSYLKIDSSFIAGLDQNTGNQAFLRGVRSITQAGGLLLHAEGVATDAEFRQIAEIGFDAATGPGVRVVTP